MIQSVTPDKSSFQLVLTFAGSNQCLVNLYRRYFRDLQQQCSLILSTSHREAAAQNSKKKEKKVTAMFAHFQRSRF